MAKKLSFQEKFLKFIKKHKKVKTKHTALATAFMIVLLFISSTSVLDSKQSVSADEENDSLLTASMVGDMMFGRYVDEAVDQHGYDYLFENVKPLFQQSDYVTGNFYQPVVTGESELEPEPGKEIVFETDEETVEALERNHFTNVNLANLHMADYGQAGIQETINAFEDSNVGFAGTGMNIEQAKNIHMEEKNGVKIATLGFSDVYGDGDVANEGEAGILPADPALFIPLVQEAKNRADLVVVHMHWGQEYDSNVHPRQKEMAEGIADAGADIIIGHHPHVLLSADVYNDTLIMYSLGNFIFDQGWSRTRDTAVANYQLSESGEAKLIFHPFRIYEGQPQPLNGPLAAYQEKQIFRQLTKEASSDAKWYEENGRLIFEVDHSDVVKGATANERASKANERIPEE